MHAVLCGVQERNRSVKGVVIVGDVREVLGEGFIEYRKG